jgi:hypothetical protein
MATAKRPKITPVRSAKSAAKTTSPPARRAPKTVKKQSASARESILAELKTVIDNPGLWLDSPNTHFGGRTPGELIGTGDEALLWEWMGSVRHGMFS